MVSTNEVSDTTPSTVDRILGSALHHRSKVGRLIVLIDPTPAVSLVECLYQLHADRKRAAGLLTMETNCRPYGEGGDSPPTTV